MSLFVIQSDSGEFLAKTLEWVVIATSSQLFQTPYKDVALNHLIEVNARNPNLRAKVITCEVNERGQPDLNSVAA